MTTVVIADDHRIVRQNVRALLEDEPDLRVTGEADSGLEAIRLVDMLKPDVLLLDMMLGDITGIEVIHRVKETSPDTYVLIFSAYGDKSFVSRAKQAGARGYVLKKSGPYELVRALKAVSTGNDCFML